uniref:J domain-containing protein n=1 Tax=viral metagenome TaxID=1070528 RepID=A0A6C0D977_9ZZZZ
MDLKEALNTLEIDIPLNNINLEYLKKQYYKLALQNHPDKNGNTIESTQKFQRIQEAYELLKREISILNEDMSTNTDNLSSYVTILHSFVDGILKGKYNDIIKNIIKKIVGGYVEDISLKLFDDMTKEQSLTIYDFIIKYKQLLRLSDEIIIKVREIILKKFKDIQIYLLNPSLNDLFQNNVYKLDIDGKIYFVPLWHSELYFDSDIVVKCNPELPSNVEIDEDNNLIITERISLTFSLFDEKVRVIKIGNYSFELPMDQLFIKRFQTFTLKKQGISRIIEDDIYKIEDKADIIIKVIFE